MRYGTLDDFLKTGSAALAKGPIALVFAEDEVEIASTLRHTRAAGFRTVVLFAASGIDVPADALKEVHRVDFDCLVENAVPSAVTRVIAAVKPGTWLYYCYNAEYLFYPFCETRSIGELLAFHTEERRDAMLCYAVDLYASDLDIYPDAVCLEEAYLDRSGYYALGRPDPATNHPKERQLDFFGGLRWRYEEHVPPERRKIDRIALFRAKAGLALRKDHTFDDEEYNTYSCPWHHNLTAAIVTFRTAKALKRNPGSAFEIETFRWHNSVPFEWHSRQLLDLGLMEPGQWF